MLKEYELGAWEPDKAPANSTHLVEAVNTRPIVNGYAPIEGFQIIAPDLAEEFRGGGAFVGSDGTAVLLAGTATKLRKFGSSTWSDVISDAAVARWRAAQFGDNVILSNGGSLISYNLLTGVGAEITATDAPDNAIDVCTVRDFVMVLRDDDNLQWSQFNDSATWELGTSQADFQPLLDGGRGVAIVGGEYGMVFQKNAVRRVTYVGDENDIIFQVDKISDEIGCMAQGSVCSVGKMIGFLSERGFMVTDGASVKPIGDEKFNRWFFKHYSRVEIETMWSAIDPRNSTMMWGIPGVPGKIIAYNWVLDRAAPIEMNFTGLLTGFTASTTLEELDALYPSGIDSMDKSLDDPSWAGGNPILMVVNEDNEIGSMTGENLQAEFRLPNLEPARGKRSRVRSIRPFTDATGITATVDARLNSGDAENLNTCASMRGNGKMPVRANGRFNTVAMTIPAETDWTYIQGIEVEFEPGDGR